MSSRVSSLITQLPQEVADQIWDQVDRKGLLSLTRVDKRLRHWFSGSLEKLFEESRDIQVLTTKAGLNYLLAILSVREWRHKVTSIHFIDHGLFDFKHSRFDTRWFGHFYLLQNQANEFRNRMGPEQEVFEVSRAAVAKLTEIAVLLKDAPMLQEIRAGRLHDHSRRLLGLRDILKSLQISYSNTIFTQNLPRFLSLETPAEILDHGESLLATALQHADFKPQVAHFYLNRRSRELRRMQPSLQWSLPILWRAVSGPNSKMVEIMDTYHDQTHGSSRSGRRGPRIPVQAQMQHVTYTMHASAIRLVGCGRQIFPPCTNSDHTIHVLKLTSYPNLSRLLLKDFTFSKGSDLAEFVQVATQNPGIPLSISLIEIHLRSGSFKPTISRLAGVSHIEDIRLRNITDAERSTVRPMTKTRRSEVRFSGKEQVKRYLQQHVMSDYYTVKGASADWQNIVFLPVVDFENRNFGSDW